MATPGWYPDPAGRPAAFRYWDGQAWGADTTDDPYAATPGYAPAPSTPVPPATSTRPGAGTVAALVLLAVLATLVVGVVTFFVVQSVR